MNNLARVMAFVVIAVGVMVGPASADTDDANQPKFIKGKFDVPVSRDDVMKHWTARGYFSPEVELKSQGWSSERPNRVRGEHTHPWNLLFTVVVGRMEFIIEGQRFVVEPGDELFYPAYAVISARNIYDGDSQMLVSYKW